MKENFLSLIENYIRKDAARTPEWVPSLRQAAISRFAQVGFPTLRQEEWKYTNVEPLLKHDFKFPEELSSSGLTSKEIEEKYSAAGWNRLVFINGFFAPSLSSLSRLPKEAKIGSLKELWQDPFLQKYLSQYARYDGDGFTALNTAFLADGALVYLPKGVNVKEPIQLLFLSLPHHEKIMAQPRNLIVLSEESSATVVETYVEHRRGQAPKGGLAPSVGVYFTNTVTEIVLKENTKLHYYKNQMESEKAFHVGTTQVSLGPKSLFSSFFIDRGSSLARNNLRVSLEAEGAECELDGLYLASDHQHIDNFTVIDHLKPGGTSRQFYKGILDGKATAVFSGKIFVRKDAQKTDAAQKNKNLLLSKGAKVNTKPQLEILADDVKCAHGAAVGQLSEEELFYLKSRGIGEKKARGILTYGFANELLAKIGLEPIRRELDDLIARKWSDGEI